MKLAIVDNATQIVVGEWTGGNEQALPEKAGYTFVAVPEDSASVSGYTWNGGESFSKQLPPQPEVTQLDRIEARLAVIEAALLKPTT